MQENQTSEASQPKKLLKCNADVLTKLQTVSTTVQTVKKGKLKKNAKAGSTKPEDYELIIADTLIEDAHVTGCRIFKVDNVAMYSVTTIDGKHHRGKL
jgi:hypothetical protein